MALQSLYCVIKLYTFLIAVSSTYLNHQLGKCVLRRIAYKKLKNFNKNSTSVVECGAKVQKNAGVKARALRS